MSRREAGELSQPEATGIQTQQSEGQQTRTPATDGKAKTEAEMVKERKRDRAYAACPSCYQTTGSLGKVTTTRGQVRYMRCPKCGWTWSISGPEASNISKKT
jgi:predicted RNA-binding Zn-ribbon protein involved in translation (DUF1610 family)